MNTLIFNTEILSLVIGAAALLCSLVLVGILIWAIKKGKFRFVDLEWVLINIKTLSKNLKDLALNIPDIKELEVLLSNINESREKLDTEVSETYYELLSVIEEIKSKL